MFRGQGGNGAVFAMTNAPSNNQINAYTPSRGRYTRVLGSHSDRRQWQRDPRSAGLAGFADAERRSSSAVCCECRQRHGLSFAVHGAQLSLLDTASTGGTMPTSVTQAR